MEIERSCKELFSLRSGVGIHIQEDGNNLKVWYNARKRNFAVDDLLYISHILRPKFIHHDLLVELYFDNPQLLRRRVDTMYSLEQKVLNFSDNTNGGDQHWDVGPSPLKRQHEAMIKQLEDIKNRLVREFGHADILNYHTSELMSTEFQNAVLPTSDFEFAYEFLSQVYRDLQSYYTQSDWKEDIIKHRYPTIRGMAETVSDAIQKYLKLLRPRFAAIAEPVVQQTSLPHNLVLVGPGQKLSDVTVLFAVAGSGKTQSIVSFLQQNIGYYILAGNVNPQGNDNLYEPRRSEPNEHLTGSRDTWSLRLMLQNVLPPWQFEALMSGNLGEAIPCDLIKLSREIIFDTFQEEVKVDVPGRWLRLQTNCSQVDPFDDIFQLLALMPRADFLPSGDALVKELTKKNQPYHDYLPTDNTRPVIQYACIDEAQADLAVPLEDGLTVNFLKGMLGSWCMHLYVVLAGTSLNIQNAIETIKSQETFLAEEAFLGHKVASKLPMIMTDNEFQALLKQRNRVLYDTLVDKNLLKPVIVASSRLRGRFRWSTMFIDWLEYRRLALVEPSLLPMTEDSVLQISQSVYEHAKDGLKRQIEKIRAKTDTNSMKLVYETLPNVAIWSHLLDQPYVFPSKEHLALVEYGLATVDIEGGELKARLGETIAVDAILESLGDPANDLIGKHLLQTLNQLQDDAGGLGTKAERLFVWELRNSLRYPSTNGLFGFDTQRRVGVMDLLAGAKNSAGQKLATTIPISKYYLLEGESISHKPETGAVNSMQLHDWLKTIRAGAKPKYGFLLPDENVGPDIVMVLRNAESNGTSGADYVLCFCQLKTGATVLSGQKLIDALNTTVRAGFYKATAKTTAKGGSLLGRKKEVETELDTHFWKAAKKLSIIVTAAQPSKNATPTLLGEEYFVWIDQGATGKVSGQAFAKLIQEVKN
ncbi:hypothetical protein FDECE_12115 [Fusarium decemcellulare]|nr:hypothetical protein FDECE_12115 [Fusarium decemcellulare]